ncbi:Cyclic di-GMP phosphodiesterase response regulator RpfG [Andreprevotia sp. IGB-42]|uniref:HD-GYP domain-containing protein n=1 Tax=Andreprevotia sp. IGB-42 TaxID=2497473 RepID=UPI00135C2C20|nr:HD domain-containing phosphohydrolase [Andreprevotia sp. IGB-42]KAF0814471.1 Cyclic di-GMP phosphodiesterase response regulator RpfG [Andreprevotia sp. IGB-42]
MERFVSSRLHAGYTIPYNLYDEGGTLLLREGFTLEAGSLLEKLQEKSLFYKLPSVQAGGNADLHPVMRDPFGFYSNVVRELDLLLSNRPNGEFANQLGGIHTDLQLLWKFKPDAALAALLHQRDAGCYATQHAVHCAVLVLCANNQLALPAAQLNPLLSATLTMNISMYALQNRLFQQSGQLSSDQRRQVDEHPQRSVTLLQDAGVADQEWLQIVAQHHEEWDGSGYPCHLDKAGINPLAHLLHVADVLGAKLWPRGYREALPPNKALALIFQGKQLDQQISGALIKGLGVYPPGTVVRLKNGDIGLVVRRTDKANAPRVLTLFNQHRSPVWPPQPRNTADENYAVSEVVCPKKLNLRLPAPPRIWEYA